jgi:hypothetical protein
LGPEQLSKSAERAWKHRFAQVLYESFCIGGVEKSAALADAYAHADAQYLVRGLGGPEIDAYAALVWIGADEMPANTDDEEANNPAANPHNGAHHVAPLSVVPSRTDLPE